MQRDKGLHRPRRDGHGLRAGSGSGQCLRASKRRRAPARSTTTSPAVAVAHADADEAHETRQCMYEEERMPYCQATVPAGSDQGTKLVFRPSSSLPSGQHRPRVRSLSPSASAATAGGSRVSPDAGRDGKRKTLAQVVAPADPLTCSADS